MQENDYSDGGLATDGTDGHTNQHIHNMHMAEHAGQ
jgi:hypothetical protein